MTISNRNVFIFCLRWVLEIYIQFTTRNNHSTINQNSDCVKNLVKMLYTQTFGSAHVVIFLVFFNLLLNIIKTKIKWFQLCRSNLTWFWSVSIIVYHVNSRNKKIADEQALLLTYVTQTRNWMISLNDNPIWGVAEIPTGKAAVLVWSWSLSDNKSQQRVSKKSIVLY